MRFTADYDSEEEEFPVDDVSRGSSPEVISDHFEYSSDDGDGEDDDYVNVSLYHSPKANHDAWVCFLAP